MYSRPKENCFWQENWWLQRIQIIYETQIFDHLNPEIGEVRQSQMFDLGEKECFDGFHNLYFWNYLLLENHYIIFSTYIESMVIDVMSSDFNSWETSLMVNDVDKWSMTWYDDQEQ